MSLWFDFRTKNQDQVKVNLRGNNTMKTISSLTFMLILFVFSISLYAVQTYNPFPRDIDGLVKTSDLVVIGSIGETVDKRLFYGYQDSADQMAELEQETPFTLGLPLVDYAIHVEEIIMDDKEFPLADTGDRTVTYRVFEDNDEASGPFAVEDRKGKMIFFLTRNPDNETYGIVSFMHRIKLGDGSNEISYSFKHENFEVPFALGVKNTDFVKEVKKYVTK